MWLEKRHDKEGIYYAFSFTDPVTGKRKRLPKRKAPRFSKYEEAKAWADRQDTYAEAAKLRAEKRNEWRNKYYHYEEHLEKFRSWLLIRSPESGATRFKHLELHILPWFLEEKACNNPNLWADLYGDFRLYLQKDATSVQLGGKKLEVATQNHIIHTLNAFTDFLVEFGLMDQNSRRPCKTFPKHMQNSKDWKNVIPEAEFRQIERIMRDHGKDSVADLWVILYRTGMRFNEGFGLPIGMLFAGNPPKEVTDALTARNLKCFGYILLESQPATKHRKRKPDGTMLRKPLKGRRAISAKNSRLIPIFEKETWNILARRYKMQKALLDRDSPPYGTDKNSYLLFEDVKHSAATRALKKVAPNRTWHDCRHSYCTYFVGKTRDFFLARAILGHKSDAFESYMHLYEKITQNAAQDSQEIDEIA